MKFFKQLVLLLKPNQNLQLGRWALKHDVSKCERYIMNYYGDPGYPNQFKSVWIKQKKSKVNE